jgi:hypothetical protein
MTRQCICLTLSGLAACLLVLLALLEPQAVLSGWLAAFAFTASIPLGCICLAGMLQIIPGKWRDAIRPGTERGLALLPFLVPAVLPVIAGTGWLYDWASDDTLEGFKAVYLTPFFFGFRSLLLLAVFSLLGLGLVHQSTAGQPLAIITLIVFALFDGVLAVDWLMSLETDFHSSGFGLYIMSLQVLTAFSAIVLVSTQSTEKAMIAILGALFLSVQLLWPYFAFMQYFIIWSGDSPQLAGWYLMRGHGVWAVVERTFVALHLASAFVLLFPPLRRSRRWLRGTAIASLVAAGLEYVWLVLPSLESAVLMAFFAFLLSLAGMVALATVLSPRFAHERQVYTKREAAG